MIGLGIGIVLLVWAFYDLVVGSVWSYRVIYRAYEPFMYWMVLCIWFAVAVACILPYIMW